MDVSEDMTKVIFRVEVSENFENLLQYIFFWGTFCLFQVRRVLASGKLNRVVWYINANVSEEPAASIVTVEGF